VTCTRSLLAPGAAPPIVIDVVVLTGGLLANSAAVSAVNAAEEASASVQTLAFVPPVPTLDPWMLLALCMLVAGAAGLRARRAD